MKEFQEQGGPVLLVRRNVEPPAPKGKWDIEMNDFRDGWQKLHALLEESEDKPAAQLRQRDDWYDRDAMLDKPPAPWR